MRLQRLAKIGLAVLSLACLPAVASAVIIVVDPRDHAIGTDLSHAYDGLTMRRLYQNERTSEGYDPVSRPVITTEGCPYGDTPCLGPFWEVTRWEQCVDAAQRGIQSRYCWLDPWSVLELTFDVPTNLVQISASFGSDTPGMMLYDSLGNEIATCWGIHFGTHPDCGYTWSAVVGFNVMTLTFDTIEANVSRVVFAGVAGNVTANQVLYRYNVPEPGALALLGLGVIGIGLSRRRRGGPQR